MDLNLVDNCQGDEGWFWLQNSQFSCISAKLLSAVYNIFQVNSQFLSAEAMFEQYLSMAAGREEEFFLQFQTQKTICSQYIKIASQRLYPQEARRISEANDLLERLTTREKVKDLSEWDVFSTRDSMILEDESSINLSNLSTDSRSKIISRKNILGSKNIRQFDSSLMECMTEIEKSCSGRTTSTTKKLVEEYKRLKSKMAESQKKEKTMKLKEKLIEDLQQKSMLYGKKIEDLEKHLEKLREDNLHLKGENKELNEKMHRKNNEINSEKKIKLIEEKITNQQSGSKSHSVPLFGGSHELINKLISEKENIVNMRFQQIRNVEQKVQQSIFKEGNSCDSCCSLIRKMKSSILSYKKYLEKEGEQFQIFVDNFKQKLLDEQKENN